MTPPVPPRAPLVRPWRRSVRREVLRLQADERRSAAPRGGALLLVTGLCLACTAGPTVPETHADATAGSRGQSVASPDGDLTVSSPQTLNRYARLRLDAAAGATQLAVDAAELAAMGLAAGDLLLVTQAQGAQIDTNATAPTHGTVTALGDATGQAGRFELVNVTAANSATGVVSISAQCGGLRNAYSVGGHSQIVRVPQYGELAIVSGGSITARTWDGSVGGIVALRAQHLRVDSGGSIVADGAGFRGGLAAAPSTNKLMASDVTSFSAGTLDEGAARGEGIAGWLPSYGRGAAGNGGGGGNAYGAGGGGGAGAGASAGWAGNGVMRASNAAETSAWGLDPAGSGGFSNEGGGGRGGYSLAKNELDASLRGPGDSLWGGNSRRERGGRGGYPLSPSAAGQIFFGGGGGAGDRIDSAPESGGNGDGGRGGGLVYILADLVDGAGSISAQGAAGSASLAATQGGAGGGGSGGSIVVNTLALRGTVTLSADGGAGGSQVRSGATSFNDALGPGGGGAGGFIAVPSGTPGSVIRRALGGQGGSSQADIVSEFPKNGATDGHAGTTTAPLNPAGATSPLCAPVDLRVSVTGSGARVAPDTEASFLISVYNDGPFTAVAAPLTAALTPRGDFTDWVCTIDAGGSATQGQVACAPNLGINNVNTLLTLTPGARATILVRTIVASTQRDPMTLAATVAAASTQSDPDPSNNTASDSMAVGPEADLAITATVAPSPTRSGQSLTYLLSVRNDGPNAATAPTLSFDVPDNARLVEGFAPFGDGWTCQVSATGRQVTCSRESLERGSAPDVTLALIPDFADTSVLGQAHIRATSFDPDLSNNDVAAVASITYDVTRYRRGVFGGGGFSCSLAKRADATQAPGPAGLGLLLLALLSCRLLVRRPSRSPRVAGDGQSCSRNPNEECLCDLPSISLSSRL